MKFVQVEARAYTNLYSQLVNSIDGILNYSNNTNQEEKEVELKNEEDNITLIEKKESEPTTKIDDVITEPTLPYNPNTRIQDLTMPENSSLKELYLTLHRISEGGLQVIASPAALAKKINDFEIPVQDLSQKEKDFITDAVGYLNNPNVKHYGHFTQVNPIKNHVQGFLKKYTNV